jgi:hypothetical protein
MPCYVGLDVSKALTSVCVMDAKGGVLREEKVATEPTAIAAGFADPRDYVIRMKPERAASS